MISNRTVLGYIGSSDSNRIYGSFDTKTFKKFWQERTSGIRLSPFSTLDTAVGNIMESRILDFIGVPSECRDVFVKKNGTIAGANMDAFTSIPHEVKTALPKDVTKYLIGYKMALPYVRQVIHAMYVTDTSESVIHMLAISKSSKKNPFAFKIKRVHDFHFSALDFDMEEHDRRIRYLSECFNNKVRPTDEGIKFFN